MLATSLATDSTAEATAETASSTFETASLISFFALTTLTFEDFDTDARVFGAVLAEAFLVVFFLVVFLFCAIRQTLVDRHTRKMQPFSRLRSLFRVLWTVWKPAYIQQSLTKWL